MRLLHRSKREQHKDDMNSTLKNEETIRVAASPEDIRLFFQSGQGFDANEKIVHFGIEGFYRRGDHTVYIVEWEAKGTTVDKVLIPEDVVESKEAVLEYLRDNAPKYRLFLR